MQINPKEDKLGAEAIAPWPILASHSVQLGDQDIHSLNALRGEILSETPELSSSWFPQLGVRSGWQNRPCLYVEDHRSISLMSEAAAKRFEYRMLGLASAKDGLLVSSPNEPDFENYMSKAIGNAAPQVFSVKRRAPGGRRRIALDAISDPAMFSALVEFAKLSDGLNLVSYISSGDVWVLAVELAKASSRSISVTAPPPAISALANDKLWFADTVRRLIGVRSVPVTREVHSMANLAITVRDLVSNSSQLVFKLPSSAGGLGNVSMDAAPMRGRGLMEILRHVRHRLEQIGWRPGDKLLVGCWDANVSASPSVQIWIPEPERGEPIIEGVFLQKVKGREGAFVGAELAELDTQTVSDLTYQATQIAVLMQGLGYVGRLSLDAVLISGAANRQTIHWIEANARWGGVSIPMTLANKITGDYSQSHIVIAQHHLDANGQYDIAQIHSRLNAEKNPRGFARSETAVFLVPPSTGLALILAIARTKQRAHELAEMALMAVSHSTLM